MGAGGGVEREKVLSNWDFSPPSSPRPHVTTDYTLQREDNIYLVAAGIPSLPRKRSPPSPLAPPPVFPPHSPGPNQSQVPGTPTPPGKRLCGRRVHGERSQTSRPSSEANSWLSRNPYPNSNQMASEFSSLLCLVAWCRQ